MKQRIDAAMLPHLTNIYIYILYFLAFFQIVILGGETLSQKSCSKSYCTSLKLIVLR